MQYYTPTSPAALLKIGSAILIVIAIIVFVRSFDRPSPSAVSLPQSEAVLGAETANTSSSAFTEYEVGADETLASISQKFQIPWDELARINSLVRPYQLAPGQKLKLPATPQVQKNSYETNLKKKIYVVQKGDTFVGIASKLELSVTDFLRANPDLSSPDFIKPGQLLHLP